LTLKNYSAKLTILEDKLAVGVKPKCRQIQPNGTFLF